MNLLEKQKALQAKWQKESYGAWRNPENLVFTTQLGEPLKPGTLRDNQARALQAAGIEGRNVHSLRHTFAAVQLHAGMSLETLSELMGHESYAFTKKQYGNLFDDTKAKEAAKTNEAFSSLLSA